MLYLDDNIDKIKDEEIERLISMLPEQRKAQALRFKHKLGRKQCVVAYMLLCKGLREEYGIEEMPVFEYGEHGKPSIVGHEDIHFNLSHCRKAVVCAISNEPIGVDIECTDRGNDNVIGYTMNEQERERIDNAEDRSREFVCLWTQKEALLKLTGEGINDDIKSVLSGANMSRVSIDTFIDDEKGYAYSIAKYCKK